MSHTTNVEALHSFTLTHDQILHLVISLASDIETASYVMPKDFLAVHQALLEMFMELLTNQEKIRVIISASCSGAIQ
jgi:hypothetical protein